MSPKTLTDIIYPASSDVYSQNKRIKPHYSKRVVQSAGVGIGSKVLVTNTVNHFGSNFMIPKTIFFGPFNIPR